MVQNFKRERHVNTVAMLKVLNFKDLSFPEMQVQGSLYYHAVCVSSLLLLNQFTDLYVI
jgi:hypothetical protein